MKKFLGTRILAVLVAMVACGASQAQLHRCTGADSKVTYTDQPCPSGSIKGRVTVVDNTTDSREHRQKILDDQSKSTRFVAPEPATRSAVVPEAPSCPSDREIKNLQTTASSTTLGKQERDFLQAEIRRAYACHTEGGNYTSSDWQRIREGHAAQGMANPTDRARARALTESIHASRASAGEHDRMKEDRRNEAIERAAKEAAKEVARKANQPIQITRCDGAGCWDTAGNRYNRLGRNIVRNDGVLCTGNGGTYFCR